MTTHLHPDLQQITDLSKEPWTNGIDTGGYICRLKIRARLAETQLAVAIKSLQSISHCIASTCDGYSQEALKAQSALKEIKALESGK